MSKKVLILSGSPRKGGNSDLLCDKFMCGAIEAGHKVEKIRIQEKMLLHVWRAMPVEKQECVLLRTIWLKLWKKLLLVM